MIFNDYKIPDNITVEDEFMYDLVDQFDSVNSAKPFILGAFTELIEHIKEANVHDEIIAEAYDVYNSFNSLLKAYVDIGNFSYKRWEELGKPLSLVAHQVRKKICDREDEIKSEFYER